MSSTNYNNTLKDFKHDLKMLLQKYDAIIEFNHNDDSIWCEPSEKLIVKFRIQKSTFSEDFVLSDGYSVDQYDM